MRHLRTRAGLRRRHTAKPVRHYRPRQVLPDPPAPRRVCPACLGPLAAHSAAGCDAKHRPGFACPCRPVAVLAQARLTRQAPVLAIQALGRGQVRRTYGPVTPSTLLDRVDDATVHRLHALRNTLAVAAAAAGVADPVDQVLFLEAG